MFNLEKEIDMSGLCAEVLCHSFLFSEESPWDQDGFYVSVIRLTKPLEHTFSVEKGVSSIVNYYSERLMTRGKPSSNLRKEPL